MLKPGSQIFRAYDIRGVYGADLREGTAEKIGRSVCSAMGQGKTFVVGRDVRESSSNLERSVMQGITSSGCNVVDIGAVPSPVVYFASKNLHLDGGIMVTASHLPPEWNGFKFCNAGGIVISEGTGLEAIRESYMNETRWSWSKGQYRYYGNTISDYARYISGKINLHRRIKAVIDYGNSVTSIAVPGILRRFPVSATEMNVELDGSSPNRDSEPSEKSLQGLRKRVLQESAEIGIAYDGDGDRVAFVDGSGRIHSSGNTIIPLFAGHYLQRNPGGRIVYDITCSDSVKEYVEMKGGKSIITRVGHSYCASEVMRSGAILGGQYSGHMVFPEIGCADDAIYASMKMLEMLSASTKSLAELVDEIPLRKASGIYEYRVPDEIKFRAIRTLADRMMKEGTRFNDTDGLKIYSDDGWVLIRASNTSPVIRINSESDSESETRILLEYGKELVGQVISDY